VARVVYWPTRRRRASTTPFPAFPTPPHCWGGWRVASASSFAVAGRVEQPLQAAVGAQPVQVVLQVALAEEGQLLQRGAGRGLVRALQHQHGVARGGEPDVAQHVALDERPGRARLVAQQGVDAVEAGPGGVARDDEEAHRLGSPAAYAGLAVRNVMMASQWQA